MIVYGIFFVEPSKMPPQSCVHGIQPVLRISVRRK